MNQSNAILQSTRSILILVLAAMILSSLACQVDVGGPASPGPAIPVSDLESESFTQLWKTAIQSAGDSGEVMIIINEIQLTSFLTHKFAEQENALICEPQVYLRDGMLHLYGKTTQGFLEANLLLIIMPVVDEMGKLSFQIIEADVGPLPLPEAMKTSVSTILTEAFTGTIGSFATGIRITSIAVANGEIAIVGNLH